MLRPKDFLIRDKVFFILCVCCYVSSEYVLIRRLARVGSAEWRKRHYCQSQRQEEINQLAGLSRSSCLDWNLLLTPIAVEPNNERFNSVEELEYLLFNPICDFYVRRAEIMSNWMWVRGYPQFICQIETDVVVFCTRMRAIRSYLIYSRRKPADRYAILMPASIVFLSLQNYVINPRQDHDLSLFYLDIFTKWF